MLELGTMKLRSWHSYHLASTIKFLGHRTTPGFDSMASNSHQAALPCHPRTLFMTLVLLAFSCSPCCQPSFPYVSSYSPTPFILWDTVSPPFPVFSSFSHWEVNSVSPPLESGLYCEFLWDVEYGKSDLMPILSLGLKRPCTFLFTLLAPCWATLSTNPRLASWMTRDTLSS